MPVTLEQLCQPSQQDLQDLHKIYADAPDWLLQDGSIEQLVATAIDQQQLWVARFNQRLLGAMLVQQKQSWHISHLCVRALSRRRGIAKRMLEVISQLAQQNNQQLELTIPTQHDYLRQWLANSNLE